MPSCQRGHAGRGGSFGSRLCGVDLIDLLLGLRDSAVIVILQCLLWLHRRNELTPEAYDMSAYFQLSTA